MHIPLKLALFGRESGARLGAEQLVELRRPEERIAFADLAEPPVLSINRDFSAPVVVEARRGADELAFLSGHDDDPFDRYEALQPLLQTGRASCRERGCQYVQISVDAGP